MRTYKKGDKIRFNGYQGKGEFKYEATTVGEIYEIFRVADPYDNGERAYYEGDNGETYVWRFTRENQQDDFTLVQSEQIEPAERDLNTLQEGDIIKFMGVTGEDWDCYRDTTVGKEYEIFRIVHDDEGNVVRARYRDDVGDAVSWRPHKYEEMYHFKVMTEQHLYKDDVLATAPTVQDLQSTLDLALLVNDIQWAQDLYQQIQQMEGEHA